MELHCTLYFSASLAPAPIKIKILNHMLIFLTRLVTMKHDYLV